MHQLLAWMDRLASPTLYLLLGAGSAVENVFPAIPADTFVALGGLMSAIGELEARWVFVVTWLCNVGSALVVYRLSYRHGRGFFESGWGRHLLKPYQMDRMAEFYDRWGTPALFLTRFLPGVRSVTPVFAGVTHQGWLPVALPIATASAIWYGGLVWLGMFAGNNLDRLASLLDDINLWLGVVALVVILALFAWWWHTRHQPHD
ncbi:MAG: DedA family protein [Gemmatimonadota bacterium]|jgi:membrane-associated protein